jgi:hypothetical protein
MKIIRFLKGRIFTYNFTWPDGKVEQNTEIDSATDGQIYRTFLKDYSLEDIDTGMRWLKYGGYLSQTSRTIRGPFWNVLTEKGKAVADQGAFDDEEKNLFYRLEDPYSVFVAHQFNKDDQDVVDYIRDTVLAPEGYKLLEGRAEGLEEFRQSILSKIQKGRFFICLLTKQTELVSGQYASSVWLYQETGVAVAYGKRPLLLVEEGISTEYIGELQRIYEYITFTRINYPRKFKAICRRFNVDLKVALIPKPLGQQIA